MLPAPHRIVAAKIGVLFVLLSAGFLARRRGLLGEAGAKDLSRILVDLALPALVLAQLLRTVDLATLRASWGVPLFAIAILVIGEVVGVASMRLFAAPPQRRTFVFLVATPNWVFLPLLIAEALYGPAGVRTIFLYNAGALLALWTLGVATLRARRPDRVLVTELLRNPGLLATALGIALALLFPALGPLSRADLARLDGGALVGASLLSALALFGSVTVPLSLFVTGALLGARPLRELRPDRAIGGVLLGRLLITPGVVAALFAASRALGFAPPPREGLLGLMIAAMPCAASCAPFAARFDGDTDLATRAVFASTLLALLSVPLAFPALLRLAS